MIRGLIINAHHTRVCVGEADEGRQAARRVDGESVGIALQCRCSIEQLSALWKPLAIEEDDIRANQRGDRVDERR